MKKSNYILFTIIVLVFVILSGNLSAQDELSGTVKYQKNIKYKFKNNKDPRWNNYIASLQTEGIGAYVLNFDINNALYQNNPQEQSAPPQKLQRALHARNYGRPPKPELKKVYYDLEKNEILKQFEFMTRIFIVKSDIETKAWKFLKEKKKILDYVCMGAELKIGEQTITAWFTPQIPISIGPGMNFGLPGLILAVEKDGETTFMATSIELTPLEKGVISKPKEGKKVSQENFDKIIKEKMEEFKRTIGSRGKGKGHGKHGRM